MSENKELDALSRRLDALEGNISTIQTLLLQLLQENRSLFADVETRQHISASTLDELRGKFRDVEQRELDIQRNIAQLPEINSKIVSMEINRLDGYVTYNLSKLHGQR